MFNVIPTNLSNASSNLRWMSSTVWEILKITKSQRNAQKTQSVTAQHLLKVLEALNKSSLMLRKTMISSIVLQEKSLETDLKTQLLLTTRDGKRSGKTEKTPSKLLQRLQAATLIVSKNVHKLPKLIRMKSVLSIIKMRSQRLLKNTAHTHTTKMSTNVEENANVSIQQLKSTGEAFTTKRLPRKNTVNPLPNSQRKNVPNWLNLSQLMKNHKDLKTSSDQPFLKNSFF